MCNHYRKDPAWRDKMDDWSETKIPLHFDRTAAIPNTAAEVCGLARDHPFQL